MFQGEVEIAESKWFYEKDVSSQDSAMVAALQDGPIVNYFRVENDFYAYRLDFIMHPLELHLNAFRSARFRSQGFKYYILIMHRS